MDVSTRRTRFEARVSLERDFLTKVNAIFGRTIPLAGMTREAIDSWKVRAEGALEGVDVRGICQILIEASTRAELLADNSRDVFEADHRPQPDSLRELQGLLDTALASAPRR